MGIWTISGKKDDLILETYDMCGTLKSYKIQYSNYRYQTHTTYFDIETRVDVIRADINLIDLDTIISLSDFAIDKSTNPDEMYFKMKRNESSGSFGLLSK